MIYTRGLKNIQFTYDSEIKQFTVSKSEMTKAEACAYSRFIFSMVQYYSHSKKKKVIKEVTVKQPGGGSGGYVGEPSGGGGNNL